MLPTTRDDAQNLARARRVRRARVLLGVTLAAGLLGGCVQADAPVNTSQVTAGGGTCKLPTVAIDPTTFGTGDSVTLKGQWFVAGCGGEAGTEPLTVISAVLTDSKGINFTFDPIGATTEQGTFDVQVQIPQEAAAGAARITVGQAGPVNVMVED